MRIDAVATHAQASPEALACVDLETDRRWHYREFDHAINRVSHWLVARLGPASGERVATFTRNAAEMLILNLACIRAGAVFVPLNWRLSPFEIKALLEDCRAALLFVDRDSAAVDAKAEVLVLADLLALAEDQPVTAPLGARRGFEETGTILYTSGTSGRPKGVMLSEANAYWSSYNFASGNNAWSRSVFLCDMPLFHTAGLLANTRSAQLVGGAVLISSGFDATATLRRLADKSLGVTHYFSVPQMAQRLWNHEEFKPEMLRGLEVYATGGAPNPKAQIERFVNAGIPMSDGFGMTETGSATGVPVSNPQRIIDKAGSCGLPYLTMEMRVVDDEGKEMPAGEPGELCLRGPGISCGYWEQPELTKTAFEDGWFRSGDIAVCDQDGFFYLVDRKKDMFISGGENVYPAEIEAAIAHLHDVAESAVVGVPDETWGEKGVAFVVPVPGREVTSDRVIEHCQTELARYKVPKLVHVVDAIPRTATGKVQKHELVKLAQKLG